jgi:hypothetical protein
MAYRQYRGLADKELRGISIAIFTSFIGLMLWSLFHSHLMETESTTVIGLMAGLALSLSGLERSDSQSGQKNLLQKDTQKDTVSQALKAK